MLGLGLGLGLKDPLSLTYVSLVAGQVIADVPVI